MEDRYPASDPKAVSAPPVPADSPGAVNSIKKRRMALSHTAFFYPADTPETFYFR